jgi:hypothetical protein
MSTAVSKKEKAYRLFAKGFGVSSPEVKALGLKGGTRYNYYRDWDNAGRPGAPNSPVEDDLIPRGKKALSEADLTLKHDGDEQDATEEPDNENFSEPLKFINEEETPPEEGEGEGQDVDDGEKSNGSKKDKALKRLPTMVAGQGLTIAVTLSLKTLTLYQYAASLNKEELALGDFIDTCVEDYYKGRGFDLGLVKIGGDGQHG